MRSSLNKKLNILYFMFVTCLMMFIINIWCSKMFSTLLHVCVPTKCEFKSKNHVPFIINQPWNEPYHRNVFKTRILRPEQRKIGMFIKTSETKILASTNGQLDNILMGVVKVWNNFYRQISSQNILLHEGEPIIFDQTEVVDMFNAHLTTTADGWGCHWWRYHYLPYWTVNPSILTTKQYCLHL